ncbi:hypothetical protein EVAR_49895_1 [Eumeta japonica]|uniref:Uncharacterized protein n=1 Tax=Eumeta variegata TaxID=151549 RepID=A0A4C1Y2M7_EUMVA|nr:hypothetical protein EVAR_49895_1 [Eumeta japonica]
MDSALQLFVTPNNNSRSSDTPGSIYSSLTPIYMYTPAPSSITSIPLSSHRILFISPPPFIGYFSPIQKADKAVVTHPGMRMSMDGYENLVLGGSHARLPIEIAIKNISKQKAKCLRVLMLTTAQAVSKIRPYYRLYIRNGTRLRLGVTYEKGVTLGNVTMSHRTRERPAECLASLSHSTMIGLPRAQH